MQDPNTENNELVLIAQDAQLEKSQVENLLQSFSKNFQEAKKIASEVKSIVVTDETQVELMNKAREARLSLKNIRVEVEKTRIGLKEQSLREGKAIDGMANIIKALVIPVEEHLQKQEDFVKLRESEAAAKKYADRIEKLSQLVDDISLYNVKDMTDGAFENLVKSSTEAREAKKQAELKAEADRVEWERKQKLLQDRKLELAPYKMLMVEGTDELDIDTTDEVYQKLLKTCKEEMVKFNKEQERIKKENDELNKKIEVERKAKEELEAKIKAEKEEQERKDREALAEAEAKSKAEDEAKQKALLAPDKEKLLKLADVLQMIQFPAVESAKAKGSLERLEQGLGTVINQLREDAKAL